MPYKNSVIKLAKNIYARAKNPNTPIGPTLEGVEKFKIQRIPTPDNNETAKIIFEIIPK